MEETIRVPKDRVAVLIGKEGKVKEKLEKLTGAKISVESSTGAVTLSAKEGKEAINFYNALNIIKAIARGFSPENAFLLLEEDYILDVLKVSDFIGSSEKAAKEKKGRVIGTHGRTRKEIEGKCDCKIAVYGKTISTIGNAEAIEKARRAIEMLLEGASHIAVHNFLKRKELEEKKFEL